MITCRTLTDGGQTAVDVAREVAAFLDEAEQSLELAVYDLELSGESEKIVLGALRAARDRGVAVRLAYNVHHPNPIPVPPPPQCVPEDVAALPVETLAVSGIPDLMHHKFVVRDGTAVLTGSTNWTDDSWTRQENVMISVESAGLGEAYSLAFDELWSRPVFEAGRVEPRPVDVGSTVVRPWFCPGYGDALSHRVAKAIGRAKRRVRICSPVISAGPVLGTLAQVAAEGDVDVAGCVDATQLAYVHQQWTAMKVSAWKIPLLETILERAPFSGKNSTPYAPGSLHDFMHAKVTVADDVVFCGSFNLSRSGRAERGGHARDPRRVRWPRSWPLSSTASATAIRGCTFRT